MKEKLKKIKIIRFVWKLKKELVGCVKQTLAVPAIVKINNGKLDKAFYSDLYLLRNKKMYKKYLSIAQMKAYEKIRQRKRIKIAFQISFLSTLVFVKSNFIDIHHSFFLFSSYDEFII